MAFNVNTYDTDLIDLGNIILDLNTLEVARLIEDGGATYVLLLLKNGHVHTVSADMFSKLRNYCRQS